MGDLIISKWELLLECNNITWYSKLPGWNALARVSRCLEYDSKMCILQAFVCAFIITVLWFGILL